MILHRALSELLAEGTRNGLTKPKRIRGTGVKMIGMGEIFANSRIGNIEMERVPVTNKELENYCVQPNDLLFARQSLKLEGAGKCSIIVAVNEPTVFESHLIRVRIDESVANPVFVYYFFNSPFGHKYIMTIVEQVAAAGLRASDLVKLKVPCPNIEIQNKSAHLLKMIDDKIALNQQINKNLEEQAQAIFDSFYKEATDIVPFTSLIQVLSGGTPKTTDETFWNGDIPFFTPKDVGSPFTITTEKYITSAGLDHCNSRLYPVNTTFVTARGTVGKVSLSGVPMAMNQSCYALASDELHPMLTYFYTLKTVQSLRHKASGAVFDAITISDFKTETLNRITGEASSKVLALIAPMMENVLQNSMENIRLAAIRDALLPRLMSGEIDVSGIEV